MASFAQAKLRGIKPSAKNVVEKYKEVYTVLTGGCKNSADLREALETFVSTGTVEYLNMIDGALYWERLELNITMGAGGSKAHVGSQGAI